MVTIQFQLSKNHSNKIESHENHSKILNGRIVSAWLQSTTNKMIYGKKIFKIQFISNLFIWSKCIKFVQSLTAIIKTIHQNFYLACELASYYIVYVTWALLIRPWLSGFRGCDKWSLDMSKLMNNLFYMRTFKIFVVARSMNCVKFWIFSHFFLNFDKITYSLKESDWRSVHFAHALNLYVIRMLFFHFMFNSNTSWITSFRCYNLTDGGTRV